MSFASQVPYDRAQRRLADNRHQGTTTGTYQVDPADDVAAATYPDPKARHLKISTGETAILDDKYALAEQDRAASGDLPDYTRPKTSKTKTSK